MRYIGRAYISHTNYIKYTVTMLVLIRCNQNAMGNNYMILINL